MRRRLRGIGGLLCILCLVHPRSVDGQETRTVSGFVVDSESGAPVSDALVTIPGAGRSVLTDSVGRFEVSAVPLGRQRLVLRHVAYGEHARALEVEASGPLHFQVRVTSRAIELEPLDVEVTSREARDRRASGTATHIIDRAAIEAAPQGEGLLPVLQSRIPSLRLEGSCIEYRNFRHAWTYDPDDPEQRIVTPCRDITVYVDGVPNPRGSFVLASLSPSDVERIEVLSGTEAGLQFMTGSRGVILVETRQGSFTGSRRRVHITGFGWAEPEAYPWLRVLAVSAVANAALVGLTSRTVFACSDARERFVEPVRCRTAVGAGAGIITSGVVGVIAHRAGRTAFTEGRTYPALLTSAVAASIGYMLYVHGENHDSDASRTTGQIVLAVGVPLSLTFSDRVFRMLR